jgi:polysaccharide export outer membrane protein
MLKIGSTLVLALALSGCASAPVNPGGDHVRYVDSSFFGPPDGTATGDQARPYLIGPYDKLVIDVFGIEELSQKEVQTDAVG